MDYPRNTTVIYFVACVQGRAMYTRNLRICAYIENAAQNIETIIELFIVLQGLLT